VVLLDIIGKRTLLGDVWAWWKTGMGGKARAAFGKGYLRRLGRRSSGGRIRFILLGIGSDVVQ
jgi:hypothetical protein